MNVAEYGKSKAKPPKGGTPNPNPGSRLNCANFSSRILALAAIDRARGMPRTNQSSDETAVGLKHEKSWVHDAASLDGDCQPAGFGTLSPGQGAFKKALEFKL